jgi:hypothetical protein
MELVDATDLKFVFIKSVGSIPIVKY